MNSLEFRGQGGAERFGISEGRGVQIPMLRMVASLQVTVIHQIIVR